MKGENRKMKKLLLVLAVFALALGVGVKSSQAVNLDGYVGDLKFKFSDWSSTGPIYGADAPGYGQASGGGTLAEESTWTIFDITTILSDDGFNTVLWQKNDDNEVLTGMVYGSEDDFWEVSAGGNQHTELIGGNLDIWLQKTTDVGYTALNANLGLEGRIGFDDYTNVTDGTLWLGLEFVPGVKYGNGTTVDDHITMDSDLDVDTINATGDGSFFADVKAGAAGGIAGFLFDTNGYALTDDAVASTTYYRDFKGEFDVELIHLPGTVINNVHPFPIISEDPIRGAVNPIPEPTTVALLGIGLVGMAGVAVRKKLKKNEVGK